MKILLLGSGGREHAIAWKIRQSKDCQQLFIAPGNAGTASCGTNVLLDINNFEQVKDFSLKESIDMIIVGPEEPLVRGIYDFFKNDEQVAHINIIGPSQEGAMLEGSKAYAKRFMQTFDIPTAAYQAFTAETLHQGLAFIDQQTPPIVLKADGLAAGKGVLILEDKAAAKAEFKAMLEGKFGAAGNTIVIEAFLDGIEFSVFALTDGENYHILPIAKDYKRIGEGDQGLNTGGMGAVSPVSFVDDALMKKVEDRIIKPTVRGLQEQNITYKGFIFFGLIRVNNDPYVIEYNCRLGDPETEVVIPRLKNDLLELFDAVGKGQLQAQQIDIDPRAATTLMLVSGGYPEAYEKGKVINGISKIEDSLVFHAGTKSNGDDLLTNGGRVLAITSYGSHFQEALETSKKNAALIEFDGKYYRKDIGFDL